MDTRMLCARPTGIGRVAESLARALVEIGEWQVSVFGGNPQIPCVTCEPVPFGHFSLKTHTVLPGIIARTGADIAHFQFYSAPWSAKTPFVVTIHDTIYSHFPNILPPIERVAYRALMARVMNRASAVICPSACTLADIRRFFPSIDASKLRVVYNGVDGRFMPLASGLDHDRARAELGLPKRYVLYVGNHRPHKNVPALVTAFARVARETPHTLVMSTPSGKGSEATLSAIEQSGIGDRIAFHDIPDQSLPLIYALADAFVFPSLYEGFGLPPLEAMACGAPTIVSATSSLPEVVGDGALLFDPDDHDALAAKLISVLTDSEFALSLHERGVGRAAEFDWKHSAMQTSAIYNEALGKE